MRSPVGVDMDVAAYFKRVSDTRRALTLANKQAILEKKEDCISRVHI